jgi:Fe-S-cluster-containing dehydrogenase component
MMDQMLLIDPKKCTGCRICEMICSFQGIFNPYRSKVTVKKNEELGIDLPILCLHCPDPPCSLVCSEKAIHRNPGGIVNIEPALCNGCQACMGVCPYGAIHFVEDHISKCNLCGGDPLCVKWCPTKAITLKAVSGEELVANRKEIQEILKQLENWKC